MRSLIALRFPAPIYADETLLLEEGGGEDEESGPVVPESEPLQSTEEMNAEQLKQYLSSLRPEDFGRFSL